MKGDHLLARRAQRLGWGIADQALTSFGNIALSVLVARSVDAAGFGAFSVAFSTYLLAQGSERAVASEPLLVRAASVSDSKLRYLSKQAAGAGLVVGVLSGLLSLGIGLAATGSVGSSFLALGLVLPGLLLQDALKIVLIGRGQALRAFLNDLLWILTLFAAGSALLAHDRDSVANLILVWGGSAALASLCGLGQAGLVPSPAMFRRWWTENRSLAAPFLGEFLAITGAHQFTLYSVAFLSGLPAVGALRAAQVVTGPVNVVHNGVMVVAIREGGDLYRRSAVRFKRWLAWLSAALFWIAVFWGLAMTRLPDRVGIALLSQSWLPAQEVIIPIALAQAAGGVLLGALIGLRALAAARSSFRARIVTSLLYVCLGTAGAALASAKGAALGLLVASTIGAWLFWRQLTREIASPAATTGSE
jgi:hypothetical protein